MIFEDVELFIYVFFTIVVVMVIVISVMFGIINGDFHHYSLADSPKRFNFGDLYEKLIDHVRHIWFGF